MSGVALARPAHVRRGVDCAFSTSADSGATCETFSSSWGMYVGDLKSLNPQINFSELDTNELYCVIGTVTDDQPTTAPSSSSTTNSPSSTTTKQPSSTFVATSIKLDPVVTTTTSTTSAGNGIATPQPTQPGMASNCNKFHWVAKGVVCSQITSYKRITLADFVKQNPTAQSDCSGMWAEVNVCVGVIGQATTTNLPPSTTTAVGNGVQTPQPTQPGMVTNCAKFHWVAQGVTCSQITSYEKIILADFVKWNPTVGNTCGSMQANVNICVGIIGGTTSTSKPTTTVKPTTTTTVRNGIQTPLPTQADMVTNCKNFHYVA